MAERKNEDEQEHQQRRVVREKTRKRCKSEIISLIPLVHQDLIHEINLSETMAWRNAKHSETKYKQIMADLHKQMICKLKARDKEGMEGGVVPVSQFWIAQEEKQYATSDDSSTEEEFPCRAVRPKRRHVSDQLDNISTSGNSTTATMSHPQLKSTSNSSFGGPQVLPTEVTPQLNPPVVSIESLYSPLPIKAENSIHTLPVPTNPHSHSGKPNAYELYALGGGIGQPMFCVEPRPSFMCHATPHPWATPSSNNFEASEMHNMIPSFIPRQVPWSMLPSTSSGCPRNGAHRRLSEERIIDRINLTVDSHLRTPPKETIVITDDEELELAPVRRKGVTERRGNLYMCNAIYIDFEIEDGEGWEMPPICECTTDPCHIIFGEAKMPPKLAVNMMDLCNSSVKEIVETLKSYGEINISSGCKTRLLLQLKKLLIEQASLEGNNHKADDSHPGEEIAGPSNILPSEPSTSSCTPWSSRSNATQESTGASSRSRSFSCMIGRLLKGPNTNREYQKPSKRIKFTFEESDESDTDSSEDSSHAPLRQNLNHNLPPSNIVRNPQYLEDDVYQIRPERVSHPRPPTILSLSHYNQQPHRVTQVANNLSKAQIRFDSCERAVRLLERSGEDPRKIKMAKDGCVNAREALALCRRQFNTAKHSADFAGTSHGLTLSQTLTQPPPAKCASSSVAQSAAVSTSSESTKPSAAPSTESSEVVVPKAGCSTEKEKEENDLDCCICLDERRSIAFIPCKHMVCCATCSNSVTNCPVCRNKISERITIYLS
ncbi:Hypothetical predicted protein [Cloeon dipterum]|uniref:RING-type domain-containing protein n=1 Tax=Cloeon dipterum TaxID=197152 RepID=A0A8S1BZT3_9INSE|nr:Hypothetical predicted protein [Cloeon dipterum]